jgi:hypothetical protein
LGTSTTMAIWIFSSQTTTASPLLLNEAAARNHWLQVRLLGASDNRQGIGARAAVLRKTKSRSGARLRQTAVTYAPVTVVFILDWDLIRICNVSSCTGSEEPEKSLRASNPIPLSP